MVIRLIGVTAICLFVGVSWMVTSTVLPELGLAFLAGGVVGIVATFATLAS